MAGVAVSNQVHVRNQFGRFMEACSLAAKETVEQIIEEGADMSRLLAPRGHKPDPRTIPIADSIESEMLSRTSGRWVARARHSMAQETGAVPHVIAGRPDLSFFWDEQGRWFVPAADFYGQPGLVTTVNHPGNPPHPYLRPAYEAVRGRAVAIMRVHYPS